ncbi:MAG: sterol desaturase family protein [Undibacterium sp.]|nr:sterol desaturase family protein [Undibacterium sp.]
MLTSLLDFFLSFIHFKEIISFIETSEQARLSWMLAFGRLSLVEQLNLLLMPLAPIVLLCELLLVLLLQTKRQIYQVVKVPFLIYWFNQLLVLGVTFDIGYWCIKTLSPFALFHLPHHWWAYLIAFVVWELSHFIFHYSSHKVRLLWCLHAPHHAPEHMSLLLIYSNTLLQGMYAQFIRISIGSILGLDHYLLMFCMAIDFCWGALIHVDERLWKTGKTGWKVVDKLFLMPIHHRIHHSNHAAYIDTNYCNTLPIWDRVFGTYQEAHADEKLSYGLVRACNSTSFIDAHFGDLILLLKDVWRAEKWSDKLLFLVMPPNWTPNKIALSPVSSQPHP